MTRDRWASRLVEMTKQTFTENDFEERVERFDQAWQKSSPPAIDDFLPRVTAPTKTGFGRGELLVELVMIDLECRWRRELPTGDLTLDEAVAAVLPEKPQLPEKPLLEDYLKLYPDLRTPAELPVELVAQEYEVRHRWGDQPCCSTFVSRFPELGDLLASVLTKMDRQRKQTPVRIQFEDSQTLSAGLSDHSVNGPPEPPTHIGRYRVDQLLGHGGFGLVYLAYDDQLDRPVAVKVPHAKRVSCVDDAAPYLAEARTVANLDHPNIVPVHDVGSTSKFPCFVVSRLIDGTDLATATKDRRLSLIEATSLVATIADALHYAHEQGIIHCDIKPGNILIDTDGKPFLVDFGLASQVRDAGQEPKFAGTPGFMSPEQARGEGDQVDGRSDIFSLGIVLYELLTGQRSYSASSYLDYIDQVTNHEPQALHEFDDTIPEELQRICYKAISKQASNRYCTARDLADDLHHFDGQAVSANPAQLLLVDDNTTNLQVLSQILASQGHRLLIAKSGESAVSIARKARPDLILLDIMMPGIDGFETCRLLKEDPATRDSVVIFLSARCEVSDKVRGLELGAVDYITKPFQAEEVIARVRTQLKNRPIEAMPPDHQATCKGMSE